MSAYRITLVLLIAGLTTGCTHLVYSDAADLPVGEREQAADLRVDYWLPGPEDWKDRGTILERGAPGAWNHHLAGGFAGAVIKRSGVFLLYYQGARSYDEYFGTVTDRAIGVAISPDGIHFRQFHGNPVVEWQPNSWLEEGAVSSAPVLGESQSIRLYYGANTRVDDWSVNADARLTYSADGLTFADKGVVLSHGDRSVWGSGDEIFPIAAVYDEGDVLLYYLPNGRGRRGSIGVARLARGADVIDSAQVKARGPAQPSAWGMGGHARVSPGTHLLFLNRDDRSCIEGRLIDTRRAASISDPVVEYCFDNMSKGTVFFDQESDTWFLYYRSRDEATYGVKTATRPGVGQ